MKKFLSFVLALCLICTLLPATTLTAKAADGEYVKKDLADIKSTDIVVITMTYTDGTVYALSSANGTGSAPAAPTVEVSGDKITSDVADALKWNVSNVNGTLTIYPNGSTTTWLYCTSSNNGVRVGNNANKEFTIDASSGYLKNTATSRYVGVYRTNPDWRCYTNTTGNTANQTLAFYVLSQGGSSEPECEHANTEPIGVNKDATCTEPGSVAGEKCTACGEVLVEEETIKALGHNYVDGICSRCGAEEPETIENKYTFSNYTAGTQYAANEVHKLDDIVTVVTTQCHFTTQLRIYSSSSNNGYAVIQSTMPITKIAVNAGNKTDTLNVYGSNDGGTTWTLIEGISVTSTSYKDYATTTAFSYKWLKLDVAGTQQVRVASMTLTLDTSTQGESDCEHTTTEPVGEAKDATCTEDGITAGEKCAACGAVITEQETIPATGHSFANGVCVCGAEKNALVTNVEDLQVGDRIVIVAKDSNYAMSTTQNPNNRGQAAVTKDANGAVGQDAQVLTLKAGMVEGTFALYTGEGYLYAASSSSNHLKTDEVKTANGSWKIEIDAEGIATIKAQGDSERNWMRYNSNSGLFACYESGQQDVVIYKLANSAAPDAVEHIYTSGSETVAKDYANINDALTVTKGTLKLLADQTIGEVDFNGVVIDLNGHTLTADTIVACVTDTAAKKGLIKVAAQDDVVLTKADGDQLILWDNTTGATGFRVFDAAFTAAGMNLKNDDTDYAKSFWSDLDFADSYAYQMVASTVSGLNVGFKLNLNGVEKTFWFSEDVLTANMRDWGDSKYSNTSSEIDYYFYITVTGFASLQEAGVLNVTPVVQDYFGNIVETSESIEFAVG